MNPNDNPETAIAIVGLRYWVAMIEHENLIAEREQELGGWLSDHTAPVHEYSANFNEILKTITNPRRDAGNREKR